METQQRPHDEQEGARIEGLRILARILARHYLAYPEKYGDSTEEQEAPPARGRLASAGEPSHEDGAT